MFALKKMTVNNIRCPYYSLACGDITSDYFENHNQDIFSPEIHSKLLNIAEINDNKVLTCAFNKVLTKSYLNLP